MTSKWFLGLMGSALLEALLVVTFLIFVHWSRPPKQRRPTVTYTQLMGEKTKIILLAYFIMCLLCVKSCCIMWMELSQHLTQITEKTMIMRRWGPQSRKTMVHIIWSGVNFTHHLASFRSPFPPAFAKRHVFSRTSGFGQWITEFRLRLR